MFEIVLKNNVIFSPGKGTLRLSVKENDYFTGKLGYSRFISIEPKKKEKILKSRYQTHKTKL